MAEAPAAPEAPPADSTPAAPTLLAGKYESPEQLQKGIRELAATIKYPIPADGELIGPDATFADTQTAEDAYKAMARMQTRQNQVPETPPETPPAETPSAETPPAPDPADPSLQVAPAPPADLDAVAIAQQAGLDPEQLAADFAANADAETGQKLKAEEYQALRAVMPGVSDRMIDDYLAAQMATAAAGQQAHVNMYNTASEMVGGTAKLNIIQGWASANIPANELGDLRAPAPGTINHRLNDPNLYTGAIQELMARHATAVGASPGLVDGSSTSAAGGGGSISTRTEYFKTVNEASRGNRDAENRLRAHIQAGGSRFA